MTLFKEVESQPDFPAVEREILRFWEMEKPFEALRRRNAKGKPWSFVDGPITANNPMGVHHAWGRTYKDIFQRHRAMLGFHQRYQNGFDCQGLWVEVEVEKALDLGSKRDILAYGLQQFSERCKERVAKYAAIQTEQSQRLGQWMDWDHSYYTYTDRNIEAIWHFLKVCHERGWLYKGFRSMPWCPRCGSSLSKHEQSDSYEELTHQSVFIRLPITGRPGEYLLAWTTTPWTLAANVALAVHPELTYLKVRQGGAIHIVAEGAVKSALVGPFEVVEKLKGSDLVGLRYTGPVDVGPRRDLDLRVIPWTDVGAAEGTGIVHIAPGCGAEDFELGQKHGLAILVPIDESGYYTAEYGELAGKYALDVAPQVFALLERTGHMVRVLDWKHRYPVCWRCKNELVFRAVDEWFIKADEIRPRLVEEAAKVRWIPEYAGKRMHDWLANNMGDWCISRKRFWGLPLPIYRSADGSETMVVGSRAELDRLAAGGTAGLRELHRPWIDEVKIVSPTTGQILERVLDVGDCWLDAGIVYQSTLPYFEDKAEWARWFPADFITEMVEQVRLWFYATLFMSVTLEGRAPYRTVLTYETVLDAYGRRISKTLKNGIPFDEAVERMGADVMRWMYARAPLSRNIRFGYAADVDSAAEVAPEVPIQAVPSAGGEEEKRITGEDARRKLLTLWNVYSFFVTYANLAPTKRMAEPVAAANLTDIDSWILARLQRVVAASGAALDEYDAPTMTREVERFVDDLSNWYVRLSRKRFSRADDEKDRQVAFAVLYRCLKTVVKLIAPVLPFTAEKIYQNLVRRVEETAPSSVHLNPYPVADPGLANDTLLSDMDTVQHVCQLAHAARAKSKLKVRQPLKELIVHVGPSPSLERSVQTFSGLIQHEVNVKTVKLLADVASLQHTRVKPNFKLLGRKYGSRINDVTRAIEAADHRDLARNLRAGRELVIEHAGETFRLAPEELLIESTFAPHLVALTEGAITVCLNTRISEELKFEGLARDAIRHVQSMRKEFDYAMGARIVVQISGAGPELSRALEAHRVDLERDTLALAFELAPATSLRDRKEVELGGEMLAIAIGPR